MTPENSPTAHEGWSNAETWHVWLEISNDRELFDHYMAMVKVGAPIEVLRALFEGSSEDITLSVRGSISASFWRAMATQALSHVRWPEIVEALRRRLSEL